MCPSASPFVRPNEFQSGELLNASRDEGAADGRARWSGAVRISISSSDESCMARRAVPRAVCGLVKARPFRDVNLSEGREASDVSVEGGRVATRVGVLSLVLALACDPRQALCPLNGGSHSSRKKPKSGATNLFASFHSLSLA